MSRYRVVAQLRGNGDTIFVIQKSFEGIWRDLSQGYSREDMIHRCKVLQKAEKSTEVVTEKVIYE